MRELRKTGALLAVIALESIFYFVVAYNAKSFGPNSDNSLLPFFAYIPFTVLAFFSLVDRVTHPGVLHVGKLPLVLNLIFLTGLIVISRGSAQIVQLIAARLFIVAKILIVQLVVWSAFFIFVNPRNFFGEFQRYRRPFLIALLASNSSLLYLLLNDLLWTRLAKATGLVAWLILKILNCKVALFSGPSSIGLQSDVFSVQILAPCSGLEGIFFFLFILSFVLLIDWELFLKESSLTLYLFGFVFMFLLNSMRIALFFWVAAQSVQRIGKDAAGASFVRAFHSYSGMVFYLLGIGIFLVWLYRHSSPFRSEKFSNA